MAQGQLGDVLAVSELEPRGHSLPHTDLARCLANTDRDRLSGLPVGPCSLALRYLLPLHDVQRCLHRVKIQADENPGATLFGMKTLVTGSSTEGLGVPSFCERTAPVSVDVGSDGDCSAPRADGIAQEPRHEAPAVVASDIDVMCEMDFLPVSPRTGGGPLYMDERAADHRGYVRVVLDAEKGPAWAKTVPVVWASLRDADDSDGKRRQYLSSDAVMQFAMSSMNVAQLKDVVCERHGPSVNTFGVKRGIPSDSDFVPALPLTEPLPAMDQWLRRLERGGAEWPSQAVRQDIMERCPCYLVATGHAKSGQKDLEWRASFSTQEKRLALSLTPTQRKVYLLIKLIQKCVLARPKVLVSYHIKTLMFLELENSPHGTQWTEEHLFSRMLDVLDRIESCLAEHFIPGYFMPDNNLISGCAAADVAAVRRAVQQVRSRPLRTLYDIDARIRFEFSTIRPLVRLHGPLLRAIEAGDAAALPAAAASSLVRQARDGIARDEHTVVRTAELLRDAWTIQQAADVAGLSFDDWLMIAAAATFASIREDEIAWVMAVLQRPGKIEDQQLPKLGREHVEAWNQCCNGTDASLFLSIVRAYLKDHAMSAHEGSVLKLFADFLKSDHRRPPIDVLESLLNAEDEVTDIETCRDASPETDRAHVRTCEDRPQTESKDPNAARPAMQEERSLERLRKDLKTVLQHKIRDGFDTSTSGRESIVEDMVAAGIPEDPARHKSSRVVEELIGLDMAGWPVAENAEQQNASDPHRQYSDVMREMLDIAKVTYVDPAAQLDHIRNTYTPLLDILGYLVTQHQQPFAIRAASWVLTFTYGSAVSGANQDCECYDLRKARRFVDCLPPDIRALLSQTSRVNIQPLNLFLIWGFRLVEGELGSPAEGSLDGFLQDWEVLWEAKELKIDTLPDDVQFSNAVLKLCIVKAMGSSFEECMNCLRDVKGDESVMKEIMDACALKNVD